MTTKELLTRGQLFPLRVVQSGGDLLKISTLYPDGNVTAQVLLESGQTRPPQRTAVRWLTVDQISRLTTPSQVLLNKAEDAWGRPVVAD